MKLIALLFISVLFNSEKNTQGSKLISTSVLENQHSILLKNSVKHHFSDNQKEDVFQITVMGSSLLSSKVHFEIIDFTGKRIYQDTFSANLLLNYGLKDNATQENKKQFIQKRIKEFFIPNTFFTPAIPKIEKFDAELNICGKEIWEEIKSDPNKTGFYYLVGEENGRRIVYSKKLKKVVVYFTCC